MKGDAFTLLAFAAALGALLLCASSAIRRHMRRPVSYGAKPMDGWTRALIFGTAAGLLGALALLA